MMDDIIGDYKDKTVTLEDFPFFDASQAVKMASVHPCRHASVMKVLLARADAALRLRKERVLRGGEARPALGMEGLVDDVGRLEVSSRGHRAGVALAGGAGGDEWEVLQHEGQVEDDVAIRVDQYLVVFLKVSGLPLNCNGKNRANGPYAIVHGECHARHRARLYDGRLICAVWGSKRTGLFTEGHALLHGHLVVRPSAPAVRRRIRKYTRSL